MIIKTILFIVVMIALMVIGVIANKKDQERINQNFPDWPGAA